MFINMAVSLGGITLTNTLVHFSISNAFDSSGRHHVLSILHDYTYDFGPFLHMHVFSFKNAHACFLPLLLACSLIYLSFSCLVSWQRILWGRKKSINKLTYVLRMMLKIQINQNYITSEYHSLSPFYVASHMRLLSGIINNICIHLLVL